MTIENENRFDSMFRRDRETLSDGIILKELVYKPSTIGRKSKSDLLSHLKRNRK